MSEIFRFPNGGYDVVVCRKKDILDTIDENIIDKEVALAIVTQCEVDATNFLREGRWTGIPYLGNMRVPKYKQKFAEIDGVGILESAKEELDKNRYVVFRKELNGSIAADIKKERLYRYMTSCFVSKHRRIYNHLTRNKTAEKLQDKDAYARFMCYTFRDLSNCIGEE